MDAQINVRVKEILDHTALTPSEFSSQIGISRSNLTHILSGRNQPGFSMLEKMLKAFPEIRGEWLITGIGNMLKSEQELKDMREAQRQQAQAATQLEMDFSFENEPESPIDENATLTELPEPSAALSESKITESPLPYPTNIGNIQEKRKTGRGNRNTFAANDGKKVKKIVFFYADNSFEEYSPA